MSLYFAKSSYQKAEVVILGIPFDRTSSFIPGSRFAPSQIRTAFDNVESYSPYQNRDLSSAKIHDTGDIVFSSIDTKSAMNQIKKEIAKHLTCRKKILSIGGEHTITVPIVQIFKEHYPKLKVIQFDAHADLRNEYLGEKLCHATAMRRVSEIVGANNLYQLGIRSMTKDESNTKMYPFNIEKHIPRVKKQLGKTPVYLTLDIDVLEIGTMPAVATPEPGGCSFAELVSALVKLSGCQIVGADLVEYNPLSVASLAYASTAAVLLREMLLLFRRLKKYNKLNKVSV